MHCGARKVELSGDATPLHRSGRQEWPKQNGNPCRCGLTCRLSASREEYKMNASTVTVTVRPCIVRHLSRQKAEPWRRSHCAGSSLGDKDMLRDLDSRPHGRWLLCYSIYVHLLRLPTASRPPSGDIHGKTCPSLGCRVFQIRFSMRFPWPKLNPNSQ